MNVIPFGGRNKGGLNRFLLRKRINTTLRALHKKNKISGLLSFWCNECAWIGKHFDDKYGIKHYCWILGQDATKKNKYPKKLKPNPGELVALSDFIREEFERNHGIRPLHLIPPGIDPKHFQFPPGKKDIDILASGSLIPLKNYDIFLEVVAEVKKQFPLLKAALIGGGPEMKKLESLLVKLDLGSNLILTGELPRPELLQWMQRAKIFLHPSSYEGFGVVCIEALHAGAQVISFVKPMNTAIQNWKIVVNKDEMIQKTIEFLKNRDQEYASVTPYLLEDSVRMMMDLFKQ